VERRSGCWFLSRTVSSFKKALLRLILFLFPYVFVHAGEPDETRAVSLFQRRWQTVTNVSSSRRAVRKSSQCMRVTKIRGRFMATRIFVQRAYRIKWLNRCVEESRKLALLVESNRSFGDFEQVGMQILPCSLPRSLTGSWII